MNTSSTHPSLTVTLVQHILPFLPASLHGLLEREAPALSLPAARLGLEVLDAERRGIPFSVAVERVAEFPLMGRVYFGAINVLQWRVTPAIRDALQGVLNQALEGNFDSLRRLIFIAAQRPADPEAALCRFVLWAAVRINLLILTWHRPKFEAIGVLDEMEDRAEEVLKRLLDGDDFNEPDCRPLHMLIAQVLQDGLAAAAPLLMGAMTNIEAELADALQQVRGLEARDAALFNPGRFTGEVGSQQIHDRFPQHGYSSTNAIEQQRSRIRKKIDVLEPAQDRFIDLILGVNAGKP
jgi:hypothetical protein